ncbi:hypothetical protein Misp01_76320 [Microtetraspora sp. NBRC 13810]|nr:hypothetical protein Misp01_76320 [Microtetraspora sp. NBRC 13810]
MMGAREPVGAQAGGIGQRGVYGDDPRARGGTLDRGVNARQGITAAVNALLGAQDR